MRGRTRKQRSRAVTTVLVVDNAPASASDPVLSLGSANDAAKVQAGRLTGLTPVLLGAYMQEFYQGRFANIAPVWERMERTDDAVLTARAKRRRKVLRQVDQNWTIMPFDDSAEAQRQAEFLRAFYGRLRARSLIVPYSGGLWTAIELMLDAIGKQFCLLAKCWSGRGTALSLELKHVPLWFFRMENAQFRFFPSGLDAGNWMPVTEEQWVIAARSEGLMEACGVACLLKRLPMHQFAHILEKWGVPMVYGKTSAPKDSPAWEALLEALQAIRAGFTGVIGGDGIIEKLEASPQTRNLHQPWIELLNDAVTTIWLGGELSTRSKSGSGTLAGGAQAEDTQDLIAADLTWLTDLFRSQIDRYALLYGLGVQDVRAGWTARLPDPKDDKADMEILEKAVRLGARVPRAYIHERFGLPDAGEGAADVLSSGPGIGLPMPTENTAVKAANAIVSPAGRRVRRDLGQLVRNTLEEARKAYAALSEPLWRDVEKADSLDAVQDLVRSFAPPRAAVDAFADVIARAAFAAVMRGYEVTDKRIAKVAPPPAENALKRAVRGLLRIGNAAAEYAPLPFDEARRFWGMKVLIEKWDDLYPATVAQARTFGFKVAGVTIDSLLRQIYRDLETAIAGDLTVDEFTRRARDKYGLNARHAENVIRTNVQTAYQWGHYRQLTHPAVLDAFPIWAFDVVLDDRTSDICRPLAGLAYRADSPIWDSLYPPNHYQCRTTVAPMAPEEAASMGFRIAQAWPRDPETGAEFMPQPGFEHNVGKVPNLADTIPGPDMQA